jgi:hypothetical protein
MRKISTELAARKAERRFFALPEGSYCLEIVEIMETNSHESLQLDENGLLIEVESAHESKFKEATPQIVVSAIITVGNFAARKVVERLPLMGYQKPNGVNDDERIAAGDTVVDGFWVSKDGDRYADEASTNKCMQKLSDLAYACLQEEGTIGQLVDAVEACNAKCNAKIVIDAYQGRQRNRIAGFFAYNESYGIEEGEAEAEEAEGY